MARGEGLFIFGTCRAAGALVRGVVQNTSRGAGQDVARGPVAADLRVFHDGRLVAERPLGTVPFEGYLELREEDVPGLPPDGECLFAVRCSREQERPGFFAQEHQVFYEDARSRAACSLVYDQMPPVAAGVPPPIVLIAPKVWVGGSVNTYVVLNCLLPETSTASEPFELRLFAADGTVAATERLASPGQRATVADGRALLSRAGVATSAEPRLYTAFGRGGSATFTIVAVVKDEAAGTLAVEHSLSPHYYMNGDRERMRKAVMSHGAWA